MEKFGFKISSVRQIDYALSNLMLAEYVSENEPSFRACIECGCCAATCTSGAFSRFSLREINILIKRGETNTVRDNINKCMFCGKCILLCPRGVNTRNVIDLVRKYFMKQEENAV